MNNIFKRLFRYGNTNSIPDVNQNTNQFIIDTEKKQLHIDIDGNRITLEQPEYSNEEIDAIRNQILSFTSELKNYNRLSGGTRLGSDADLNNIATPGNYYCSSNTYAEQILNCPAHYAFILKVEHGTGVANPSQTLREYYSGIIWYRRQNSSGDWSNWLVIANGTNYSYEEIIIGTWLGKPLYGKMFDFGFLPNNSNKVTEFDSSFKSIIKHVHVNLARSMFFPGSVNIESAAANMYTMVHPYITYVSTATAASGVSGISIGTSGDLSGNRAAIYIEYTKNTD